MVFGCSFVVIDGSLWFLVVLGVSWWFLVVLGGSRWFLAVLCGFFCGSLQFLVVPKCFILLV